jgi:hypothetical protein
MTKTKKGKTNEGKAQECSGFDRNKIKISKAESKPPFPVIFGSFFGLSWLLSCIFLGLFGFAAPFIKFASPKK